MKDFIVNNKLEVTCVLASSAIYQLITRLKKKEGSESEDEQIQDTLPRLHSLSIDFINTERIESSFRIPNSILKSDNSLIDEVQHLNNPACKIQKVPHLILELVPDFPFRVSRTFLRSNLR